MTASGSPVVGAKVSIDGNYAASTDEAGIYKLENIKTGTYTIDVAGLDEAGMQMSFTAHYDEMA